MFAKIISQLIHTPTFPLRQEIFTVVQNLFIISRQYRRLILNEWEEKRQHTWQQDTNEKAYYCRIAMCNWSMNIGTQVKTNSWQAADKVSRQLQMSEIN